jgi:nucleotide-binding universal stress UspA family protein
LGEQRYETRKKIVVARDVAEAIVAEANSDNYMFVVMTKRRPKKGLGGVFHRSVSERVIREANCMVLTTLSPEAATPSAAPSQRNTK